MAARAIPLVPPGPAVALRRALALRCPRCGGTRLFAGPFRMQERCAACGLTYEREQGFFVGAIYVNYAVTVASGIGLVLALDWLVGLTLTQQLVLGVAVVALVPLVFFRYSRSLWLAIDFLATS